MELNTVDRKLHAMMNFWGRILEDRAVRDLDDLAKLIIGCEVIVALDDVSLLSAKSFQIRNSTILRIGHTTRENSCVPGKMNELNRLLD
jgi:hypothetical protein